MQLGRNSQPEVAARSDARADLLLAAIDESRVPSLLADPGWPGAPIVHVNRSLVELTARAQAELLGRELSVLLGPEPDLATLGVLRAGVETRTACELETELVRKDGTRFRAVLFISPVTAPDGRVRYLLCSVLESGRRSEHRHAIPEQARLAEFRGLARGVAHQFNNLLTLLLSNFELLRDATNDARVEKRLARATLAIDRITELVHGFIATVRGASGEASPEPMLPRAREGEVVLVVEPDEALRSRATAMLRSLGYRVEPVAGADEALARLSSPTRVDLLLADAAARCVDGVALSERRPEEPSYVPVLYSCESPSRESPGPDRHAVVLKPFQLVALAREVRNAIDGWT